MSWSWGAPAWRTLDQSPRSSGAQETASGWGDASSAWEIAEVGKRPGGRPRAGHVSSGRLTGRRGRAAPRGRHGARDDASSASSASSRSPEPVGVPRAPRSWERQWRPAGGRSPNLSHSAVRRRVCDYKRTGGGARGGEGSNTGHLACLVCPGPNRRRAYMAGPARGDGAVVSTTSSHNKSTSSL